MKFSSLSAGELEFWKKIEAVEARISKFFSKGVLWTDF